MTSLYLINPIADGPTYFGAEVVEGFGLRPAVLLGDLAITTVAALAPRGFEIELCDENLSPIDFDTRADYVAITGKVSQWSRMRAIAYELRRRGRTVILGGPFVSLCPEVATEHCDILVRGEIEEIAPGFFADLACGRWQAEYVGTRPALDGIPVPRWDLYPNERTLMASLQTSRGCPFDCEFCDVIQYLGRRQRHKPVGDVLAELDLLYRLGYRSVFLSDDNFTSSRGRAKELLGALAHWNKRRDGGEVLFSTQLSIDAARDEELLGLCARAGLRHVFIGIETPNEASLRESGKRQNVGVDLVEQVQRFHAHGIGVIAGMIVGFDHDGPDIFERQLELVTAAAIPIATLGALVAPAATPLHRRMLEEGRLTADGSEVAAAPWSTNIVPKGMSSEELADGIGWLFDQLYEPSAFAARLVRFIAGYGGRRNVGRDAAGGQLGSGRPVERDGLEVVRRIARLGDAESRMLYSVFGALSRRPEAFDFAARSLLQYAQVRHMARYWSRGRGAAHRAADRAG